MKIILQISCLSSILYCLLLLGMGSNWKGIRLIYRQIIWSRNYIRNILIGLKMGLVYRRLLRIRFWIIRRLWINMFRLLEIMMFWAKILIVLVLWIFFKEMRFQKVRIKPKSFKEILIYKTLWKKQKKIKTKKSMNMKRFLLDIN